MKKLIKFMVFCFVLFQLASCGNYLESSYTVILPSVPKTWTDILGEPNWRVEWLESGGILRKKDIKPGESLTVALPATWTNPVTAWPWWPSHNLIPGLFKPAGGFFPHEVSGGRINLSWEAGHETVYYMEMAFANSNNEARLPANFDWLRFRELFTTGVLDEAVCNDPWLIDWQSVAERTIASGFDRRRLSAETASPVETTVKSGLWYGASPFAEPLFFKEEEIPVFPVRSGINVWISEHGILRVSEDNWVFTEICTIAGF